MQNPGSGVCEILGLLQPGCGQTALIMPNIIGVLLLGLDAGRLSFAILLL